MECDLYLRIKENPDGETASLSCKELLKDSSTQVILINPENDESDVVLGKGEMIWIEVTEAPQSLRAKLLQLERAVRYFNGTSSSIVGRGAVMVCLNGEKTVFDDCLKHLEGLYRDGKLQDWLIFAKVPLFVTYTPFRNVYKSIGDVADRLEAFETKVDTRLDAFETKVETEVTEIKTTLKALDTNVETEVAEMKTTLKALDTKVDTKFDSVKNDLKAFDTKLEMMIKALNANRPQESDTRAEGRRRNRVVNGQRRIPRLIASLWRRITK